MISDRYLAIFRVGKFKVSEVRSVGLGILFQIWLMYCCATLLTATALPIGVPAGRIEVQVVELDALKQIGIGNTPCFMAEVGTTELSVG